MELMCKITYPPNNQLKIRRVYWLSILRPFLGWLLIILGIFGLVLPILQGWLFLALGAFFLAPDIPLFARIFYWIERRYPNIQKTTKHIHKIFLNRGDQSLPPSPFHK